MSSFPLTNGIAGIIIRKDSFERLHPKDQQIVRKILWQKNEKLVQYARVDTAQARQDLINKFGLEEIPFNENGKKEFQDLADILRQRLVDEFYSQKLLDQVYKYLGEFRAMTPDEQAAAVKAAAAEAINTK